MSRPTLLAAALVLVVVACGTEASPTLTAEDAAAVQTTAPAASATTVASPTTLPDGDMMDDDDMAAQTDGTMDHDEMDDQDMAEHQEGDHRPGDVIPEAVGEPTMEIDVVLNEFSFDPDPVEIEAGTTVRFHLTNEGAIQHEFRLSNDHRVEEHLASGHADHEDEGGHHEEDGDIIVLVETGETRVVDITFPAEVDTYTVVACLLPGHYEAGMFAPLAYQNR